MKTQYTQIRIKPIAKYAMKEAIRHDLRTKKEERAINDNVNQVWIDGKIIKYQRYEVEDKQNEEIMELSNNLIESLDDIREEHKKLYRINHNQSLNLERTQSYAMGILSLSESFKELVDKDADKMMELGIKTIQDVCKKLDTKLYYVSFHTDEEGIPHFQFVLNNYNSQGKSIKANRSKKVGEMIQDMSAKYFADYGFIRGVSKEKTGRKHLSIEEYKEYMELKDKEDKLKEEILKLREEKEELLKTAAKLYHDNKELEADISNTVNDIYDDLEEIQDTNDPRWYAVKIAQWVEQGKTKKLTALKDKLGRKKQAIAKKKSIYKDKNNSPE